MGDHTEAVQIDFDPEKISYRQIADMIWRSHDPRRQSPSRQYRYAVWYANSEQQSILEETREQAADALGIDTGKIQTDIEPLGEFTYAEDYHQKYILRRQIHFIKALLACFPDARAFCDSTIASRLNGWFGNGTREGAAAYREEVAEYGLPSAVEQDILRVIV